MKQKEVLDHVLKNDCYIYEQRLKDDGIYYFVRRNETKKMVVIYPVKDDGSYTPSAICHICETLGKIPVPPYAAEYLQVVQHAKKTAKKISDFPSQGMN